MTDIKIDGYFGVVSFIFNIGTANCIENFNYLIAKSEIWLEKFVPEIADAVLPFQQFGLESQGIVNSGQWTVDSGGI